MSAFVVFYDEISERWDVNGARSALFKAKHHEFVPFGNFIEERLEAVTPSLQPDKEWPVYGVSNRDGVFLSHMQLGSVFQSRYKVIKQDWFFHNPTRANVGSLGRVPQVPDDALTSPEYQVWSIKDQSWLPGYVEVLIKMPFFNSLIQSHRVGAVKERMFTRNLMLIPVPVRDNNFQRALIKEWNDLDRKLSTGLERIQEHEETLVAEVLASAGIEINIPEPRARAYSIGFDEIERWGVSFNRQRWTLASIFTSTLYPTTPLADVALVNPEKTKRVAPGAKVSFVPMEAVSAISGKIELLEDRFVEEVSTGYTAFEESDVIWAKITPCMQNGKCAVARSLTNEVGYGSTEFHVIRSRNVEAVLPDYLWILLRLKAVRNAAQRYFIGSAGQQRVPDNFLNELRIPLPSPDIQKSIIQGVREKRKLILAEQKSLETLRTSKMRNVEQAILLGDVALFGETGE